MGIVAFRASPVWVLAAMADVCGMGRHLIPEIADALKAQGLLEKDAQFTSVDQLLDGLERTSSRLASTVNTPPLDVAGAAARSGRHSRGRTKPAARRSAVARNHRGVWKNLKTESARQDRSIFETSSMMALSAVRAFRTACSGSMRRRGRARRAPGKSSERRCSITTRQTLDEIRQTGYPELCRAAVSSLRSRRGQVSSRRSEDADTTHARQA